MKARSTNPIIAAIKATKDLPKDQVYARLNEAYEKYSHLGENAKDRHGRTPLMIAVKEQNVHAVSWLLDESQHKRFLVFTNVPDINAVDEAGYTALTYAVKVKDTDEAKSESVHKSRQLINILLKHKADPLKDLWRDISAPSIAAQAENYYFLKIFFKSFPMTGYQAGHNSLDQTEADRSDNLHMDYYRPIMKAALEKRNNNLLRFMFDNKFIDWHKLWSTDHYASGIFSPNVYGFIGAYSYLRRNSEHGVFTAIRNCEFERAKILLGYGLCENYSEILYVTLNVRGKHHGEIDNELFKQVSDFVKHIIDKNYYRMHKDRGPARWLSDPRSYADKISSCYNLIVENPNLNLSQKKELIINLQVTGVQMTRGATAILNGEESLAPVQVMSAPVQTRVSVSGLGITSSFSSTQTANVKQELPPRLLQGEDTLKQMRKP